jgi:MFS family permease
MMIMGLATVAIGFVPTYGQIGVWAPVLLVVLRVAQGVAIGGEWGGAVLMAVEYAPAHRRGLYGSIPQIGLALGLMLGTGVFAGLSALLTDEAFLAWGWRVAFIASAVLVVVGIAVRLRVLETPAFRKLARRERLASVPVLQLLRDRQSRTHILLGIGTRLAEGITFNAWAVFVLSYGTTTLGMSRQPLLVTVMIAAGVMAVFIPIFGRVSDRVGRRTTYCVGAIMACALAVPAFAALQTRDVVLIVVAVSAVLGVAFPIMYGPQAAFYAELFPTPVRYTGISFVYQFAGIFSSGITPFVLAFLVAVSGGGYLLVVGYFAATTLVSVVCAVLVKPLFRWRFTEAPTAWWYAR